MRPVSRRRKILQERDIAILGAAEEILLSDGYYGLTMEAVASKSKVSKGTVYLHFGCKEDVVLALANRAVRQRNDLIRRGAGFEGRARERVLAIGEAMGLFERLHTDQSSIIHMAMGTVREKASAERVAALVRLEEEATGVLREVVEDAVASGDLTAPRDGMVEELLLSAWALVDGAYTLIESGAVGAALKIKDPFHKIWRGFNVLADGYGWRPLFSEWDYEESMVRARKEIFPEEAQRLYGEGNWYGDGI
jgi:AcrR family transcriptional regulator